MPEATAENVPLMEDGDVEAAIEKAGQLPGADENMLHIVNGDVDAALAAWEMARQAQAAALEQVAPLAQAELGEPPPGSDKKAARVVRLAVPEDSEEDEEATAAPQSPMKSASSSSSSMKSARSRESKQSKLASSPAVPAGRLEEGWLKLRRYRERTWTRVFCVLGPDEFSFTGREDRGIVDLRPSPGGGQAEFTSLKDCNHEDEEERAALQGVRYGFALYAGGPLYFMVPDSLTLYQWKRALKQVGVLHQRVTAPGPPAPARPGPKGVAAQLQDRPEQRPRVKPKALLSAAGRGAYHGNAPSDAGGPFMWLRVGDGDGAEAAPLHGLPAEEATVITSAAPGQLLQVREKIVCDDKGQQWAELSAWEAWNRYIEGPRSAYIRITEGVSGVPLERWPEPDHAEAMGVPWVSDSSQSLRPRPEAVNLCIWQPLPREDEDNSSSDFKRRSKGSLPRRSDAMEPLGSRQHLAVCAMAHSRASRAQLETWLLYHLRIGFERVYLYLDAPCAGTGDLVEKLKAVAAPACSEGQVVQVASMTNDWWSRAEKDSRFFAADDSPAHGWLQEVVDRATTLADPAARQQICCDLAMQDAIVHGARWMLHLGPDELFYAPGAREDAPAFFRDVPADVELLRFLNFEAVPETRETGDAFRSATLFKPAPRFLQQDTDDWPRDDFACAAAEEYDSEGAQTRHKKGDSKQNKNGEEPSRWPSISRSPLCESPRTFSPTSLTLLDFHGAAVIDGPLLGTAYSAVWERICTQRVELCHRMGLPAVTSLFLGHEGGRSAVRLSKTGSKLSEVSRETVTAAAPIPSGPHLFCGLHHGARQGLRCMQCDGRLAPVVLHYVHCSFSAWAKKYEAGADSRRAANQDADHSQVHVAARELAKQGRTGDIEHLWQIFVMGNSLGELPYLAGSGLLVRISAVLEVVEAARGRGESPSQASRKSPGGSQKAMLSRRSSATSVQASPR